MHRFSISTLLILLTVGILHCNIARADNAITTCAIRWDAWYTNGPTDPAHYTALTLSPTQWHNLAPSHAVFDSAGNITWAPTQATFDAEIKAAYSSTLCWAYLMYGTNNVIDLNNSMMKALAFHRSSTVKNQARYAMMTTTELLGKSGQYTDAVNATLALMHDSNYQFVTINAVSRPLLFLFYMDQDLNRLFAGSLTKMKEPLDAIRNASIAQGLGNPYIVILYGIPSKAETLRQSLGGDAISAYVTGTVSSMQEAWSVFEQTVETSWNTFAAATAANSVPILRSGADIRARCQTPPPWELSPPCSGYAVNPTLDELKTEFIHGRTWVNANASKDPASLLLVYAWSECDESGNCLMPTIGDPTAQKLTSIFAGLYPLARPTPPNAVSAAP